MNTTENEAEQTLCALLQEGMIQETEEGPGSGKFEPTTTTTTTTTIEEEKQILEQVPKNQWR